MLIGTCSECGGPVTTVDAWSSVKPPPPPKCESCGAEPEEPYGRTIPMRPRPKSDNPDAALANYLGWRFW